MKRKTYDTRFYVLLRDKWPGAGPGRPLPQRTRAIDTGAGGNG